MEPINRARGNKRQFNFSTNKETFLILPNKRPGMGSQCFLKGGLGADLWRALCRAPSVLSPQRQSGDCRRGRLGVPAPTTQDLDLQDASSHQVCIFWITERLVNELVDCGEGPHPRGVIFIWCVSTFMRARPNHHIPDFHPVSGSYSPHSEPVSSPSTTRRADGVCALIRIIGTAAAGRTDRGAESPVSSTHTHLLPRSPPPASPSRIPGPCLYPGMLL